MKNLAKIEQLNWLEENEVPPASATALINTLELHTPLAGIIDSQAEIERLNKEIAKLDKEIIRSEGKLSNEKFVSKAPKEVIDKENERLAQAKKGVLLLSEKLQELKSL